MVEGLHRRKSRASIARRTLLRGAAISAFMLACGGERRKESGAGSTAGAGQTGSGGGLLPGQLSEAEKAEATTVEKEYRLKYHFSKLRNLPGQQQGPKYGGVFRCVFNPPVSFDVLDPGSGSDSAFGAIYNGLIDLPMHDFVDAHRGIRPTGDLAESWEQPEPTVIIFKLHQGVRFHDRPPVNGRTMTVEDVRISYEAYRTAPYQAPNYVDVKSIEAVDSNHIRFTFNRPAAYFLNNLLSQKHVVVPPELLGTERSKTEAVGTGPMILKSWKPNQSMELERNPAYFKKDARTGMQLPYLDGWQSRVIGDRNSLLAAWKSGQIDHVYFAYGLKEPKSVDVFNDPNAVFQVVSPSAWGMTHIAFKLEKAPWNDARVRRALSLALNRKEMVDGLADGLAAEGAYPLDWTFFKDPKTGEYQEWPWRPDQLGAYQKYDPDQARQLLQAAGFSSQRPLELEAVGLAANDPANYLLRHQTHLAIVDQWRQAFRDMINVRFIALESLAHSRAARTRDYNDVFFAWLTGPAYEPDGFLFAQLHSRSTFNYYGIKDMDIDRWTEAQRVEMDNDRRQQLWRMVMERDLDQVYRVFTYHAYKTMARRANVFNVLDVMHAWAPGFRGPAQWGWKA